MSAGAKFHLPSLTKSMGFSNTNAQLLSAPPYLLACVGCIVVPYISDRCKRRGYCESNPHLAAWATWNTAQVPVSELCPEAYTFLSPYPTRHLRFGETAHFLTI